MRPKFFFLTLVVIIISNHSFSQSKLGESSITLDERRIALVIGMNDYEHIRPLKNPANDAEDMAVTLETLGFSVTKIKNQTHGQLTASINKFINGLRANDVVMFYFSGHGIGYLDDNYLLPTDARIECLEQISAYSISVKRLTADIQSKKVRNCFVVLDACRSLGNLFACNDNQNTKDLVNKKGFVIPQNQLRGNVIVYATQAGQTAEDNQKNRNGLFTQELLKNIIIPDLTFGAILTKTAVGVVVESQKLNAYQEPIVYGLIGTDFVFLKNDKAKQSYKDVNSIELETDLSDFTPSVADQGGGPNVVFWATLYTAYGTQLAKKLNLKTKLEIDAICLSPAFALKQDKRNCENGSTLTSAAEVSMRNGSVLFKDYQDFDCKVPILDSIYAKRIKHYKIAGFSTVFDVNSTSYNKISSTHDFISRLKTPVIVGLPVNENLYSLTKENSIYKPDLKNLEGYTAVVIIGYDNHRIKLLNSWGKNWGDNGYFWMYNEDFTKYIENGIALEITN